MGEMMDYTHLIKSLLVGLCCGGLFLFISFLYLGKEANKIVENEKRDL